MSLKGNGELRVDPSNIKQDFVKINLSVHCCRYWKLTEWEYQNLSFSFWRLYYNSIDGATVHFKGNNVALNSTKVVLIPPFTSFSTSIKHSLNEGLKGSRIESLDELDRIKAEGAIDHLFIHFNLGIHFDQIKPGLFVFDVNHDLVQQIDKIRNTIIVLNQTIDNVQSLQIYALLLKLVARIDASNWIEKTSDTRVLKIINYIDKHYSEHLSNEFLADLVSMASNSFLRLFKMEMGLTIQRYLQRIRIDKAIVEMHNSPVSIDTIAARCGFSDRHHFSKVFKRFTGMPPAQYRQQKIYY